MKHKVTEIIAFLFRRALKQTEEEMEETVAGVRAAFPGITDDEIDFAFDAYDAVVGFRPI